MLKIDNISFSYPHSKNILNDISFSLENGESLRLEGTNGSGKTTILNCISRFLDIKSGDILVDGISIKKKKPNQLYKLGIRRFWVDRLGFDNMTVKENIRITHWKKSEWMKTVLMLPYLNDILDREFMSLSGGEKVLVSLSMIFNTDAKLLLLDEPFGNLHAGNANKIITLLDDIKKTGCSILIVDHSKIYKTDKIFKLEKVVEY